MDEATQATHAKDEFFSADMYVFHVTGFPQPPDVLTRKAEAPPGARLDVWRTDPASDRHIPGPGAEGVAFSTADFSLVNSGNRTLRTPKRSWKITLENASGDAARLAGMTCVNLKSMYNDPSQMREALAWRLFGRAGVPAARHTYAKLAFDATYYGLFSVIEQVDKRFLKDHFGGNHRGNLYKAYCGDVGCATLEHRAGPDGDDSGRQYYKVAADDDRTYRLKTNEDDRDASTYDDLAMFIRTINGMALGDGDSRFDSDAFRESVDGIMNAPAFLRWAAVNVLLGSWDNYYATPSNYYLYNSGRLGAQDDSCAPPISRSSRGTTTTAWVSTTSAPNGSTPTYSTGPAIPGTTGGNARPRGYRWCRTCCAIVTTGSITWTIWSSCSTPSSTRTRSGSRSRPVPATACGGAHARLPTWSRRRRTASRSPVASSPTTRF